MRDCTWCGVCSFYVKRYVDGCFLDGCFLVIWSFCWLWASQKLALQRNCLRRNWIPEQLSWLLIHAYSIPPWLLRPVKSSTNSELNLDYFQLPTFFMIVQASCFLIHRPFPTQSVRLPLVTYPSLCSTIMTYRTPCHVSGHQVLPTQPLPREAEDFPRGGKHSKHVPLLTYLAWLQPIIINNLINT